MRTGLFFSLFVLGISSIISQMVVLRELAACLYGNEFFIGIILGSWLAWVAIGSAIFGKIKEKLKNPLQVLIILHLLAGLFLFLEIFIIRFSKVWLLLPGEIPNLLAAFIGVFLMPAPLCLILGFWWTIAAKLFSKTSSFSLQGFNPRDVNFAYFIETLGFILGGIMFSFALAGLQEFLVAGILFSLNLTVIFFLSRFQKKYPLAIVSFLLFLISIWFLFSSYPARINQITNNYLFKNQKISITANSPYGNIAVTKTGSQYNFYVSGLLLGTTQNTQSAEEFAHLALLCHPAPQRILLIGNGFNGVLQEMLKHSPEKIYYAEFDSKLIEIAKKCISSEELKALTNPKVEIINTDGRYFLNTIKENFDVILVNLPDPSTALLNRFYTQEFFEKAKERLSPQGIFVTHLSFSPSAPNKNLENLNLSIFKTLNKVFPQVIVLSEENNLFLAFLDKKSVLNPEVLFQRFQQRNIKTKFLNYDYIFYRLSPDRINKDMASPEKQKAVKENKDFSPIAYFYHTLFWMDYFYPRLSRFFQNFALGFWLIFAGILMFLTLFLFRQKKGAVIKNSSLFSVVVAGFSLMALEIIIIFVFQITIGYLYHRISLLISALMAGMALGVWQGKNISARSARALCSLKPCGFNLSATGKTSFPRPLFFVSEFLLYLLKFRYNKTLNFKVQEKPFFSQSFLRRQLNLHILLIGFCFLLPFIFLALPKISSPFISEIILLISALTAGFLGSAIFPLANYVYLSFQQNPQQKISAVYSVDLIGSCLGAILPGLIIIPVFGVFQCLIFIAGLNFLAVLLLFVLKHLGSKGV